MRRRTWAAAASFLLAAGLSGCDLDDAPQGRAADPSRQVVRSTGTATAELAEGREPKPPRAAASRKARVDALDAAPAGASADDGRVRFDGAAASGADSDHLSVYSGPRARREAAEAVYTAPARKATLSVIDPPAPGDSTTSPDFSRLSFDDSRSDAGQRRAIFGRARRLMGIPYKLGADSSSQMDCSSWLSRVWSVPRHSTAGFLDVSYKISKDELRPGDALLLDIRKSVTGYGHIRLFAGWANAARTKAWICEEGSLAGSVCKKVAYVSTYQPIRRKDLPRPAGSGEGQVCVAASFAPPACRELPGLGCLYAPEGSRRRTLLVFLRGHYGSYDGNVPAALIVKAARDAFASLELGVAADASSAAVLVTGSSHLAVSADAIAEAERLAGVRFRRLILAAHSGGYVGLRATLASPSFPSRRVSRVVMLDDFYSDANKADLARLTADGVSCTGFYTPQSDAYLARALSYSDVCALERGASHSGDVNACLADYSAGRSCARTTAVARN